MKKSYASPSEKFPERQANDHHPGWILIFLIFFLLAFLLFKTTLYPAELRMIDSVPFQNKSEAITRPDQLPQSQVVQGTHDIALVWLASPTDRYSHGVLGDKWEAGRLVVEMKNGRHFLVDLPLNRVFEDLEPRLADMNGDNRDEIIVVETDVALGASLALYGIVDNRLVRIAATPFLGRPHRWVNPVGAGDFDGDGNMDVALVATPHIGGILRLYHFSETGLSLFAEYPGVSTHRIGSTELGFGRVVSALPRNQLLVPDQTQRKIMLLEWSSDGWRVVSNIVLPVRLNSSLIPLPDNRWRLRLEDDRWFEIQLN